MHQSHTTRPARPILPKLHIPTYVPPSSTHTSTSTDRQRFIRPPKLKRMAIPQKIWKPSITRAASQSSVEMSSTPPIKFDLVGGHSSYGIPISMITSDGENPQVKNMIQNSDDLVLNGVEKINFRILWPGCEHVDWNRTIKVKTSSGQMTRGRLAEEIVRLLWYFIDRLSYEVVNPNKKVWTVGRGTGQWGIENIILVSLHCA